MKSSPNIYLSLDEAREELSRRRRDTELRRAVEAELGEYLLLELRDSPRAVIAQHLATPSNSFLFFYQAASYVGAMPFYGEFHGDTFSASNPNKRSLVSLRVIDGNRKLIVNIASPYGNDGKEIRKVVKNSGKQLVEFHHRLLELSGHHIEHRDMTNWYRHFGKSCDYYYPLLLNFAVHGVLFEYFLNEDEEPSEGIFTKRVVLPAIRKIQDKFGIMPMIIRSLPENQSEEEDFHWLSYPKHLNDYILHYANEYKLPFREVDASADRLCYSKDPLFQQEASPMGEK